MEKLIRQIIRFGAVGVASTVIDILVLNVANLYMHIPIIPSNMISTSLATIFNYYAHKKWTFKKTETDNVEQNFVAYIIITITSVYVIQTGILYLLANIWSSPVTTITNVLVGEGLIASAGKGINLNIAKLYALAVAAVYSFILYKNFAFTVKKKS